MRTHPLSKRYARALFELAEEAGISEQLLHDLQDFDALLRRERRIKAYLFSPEVDKNLKLQVVETLVKGNTPPLLYHFIVLLVQKGRQQFYAEILFEFNRLYDRRAGRLRASVISAIPITEKNLQEVQKRLSAYLHAQVICDNKIDAEILGGLIVKVEGKVVDGSLRHQWQRLRKELHQSTYNII